MINQEEITKSIKKLKSKNQMYIYIYIYIYIVVKGNIIVTDPNNAERNKAAVFRNNVSFINCISKVNSVKIDNAEDLDVVMPTCHLLEDSKNYRKITGKLWSCYRDERNDILSSDSKSFKYKTSITVNTYNVGNGE